MKATGIVRRVDELGRIVMPKEIRKNLRIKTGTPLEILTDENGLIIFKKFSVISELNDFAQECCNALHNVSGFSALVCDMDKVAAASKDRRKEYENLPVNEKICSIINERKTVFLNKESGGNMLPVKEIDANEYTAQVVSPILANGDAYGAIIIFSVSDKDTFTDCEVKLARTMAEFIANYLES